jgi:hypothetical protein
VVESVQSVMTHCVFQREQSKNIPLPGAGVVPGCQMVLSVSAAEGAVPHWDSACMPGGKNLFVMNWAKAFPTSSAFCADIRPECSGDEG